MLEVGRVNFKHVGAHLMLEVRRARLLQAWLIYQSDLKPMRTEAQFDDAFSI